MFKYVLAAYALIFAVLLALALGFRPEAVVPILGFFLLIFPTFLLCCTVLLLLLRSLPLPRMGHLPIKLSFFSLRK